MFLNFSHNKIKGFKTERCVCLPFCNFLCVCVCVHCVISLQPSSVEILGCRHKPAGRARASSTRRRLCSAAAPPTCWWAHLRACARPTAPGAAHSLAALVGYQTPRLSFSSHARQHPQCLLHSAYFIAYHFALYIYVYIFEVFTQWWMTISSESSHPIMYWPEVFLLMNWCTWLKNCTNQNQSVYWLGGTNM